MSFNETTLALIDEIDHGMRSNRETLVVVESITGGLVSALLTQKGGVSSWYHGGLCLYSKCVKQKILQLPKNSSTVGEAATVFLAEQAFVRTQASITLAITGEAGPQLSEHTYKVGDVFICVAKSGQQNRCLFINLTGDRISIQKQAALKCLELLKETVVGT